MTSSGIRGGTIKTGILHTGRKEAVERDAYGGPKCGSKLCSNDDDMMVPWKALNGTHMRTAQCTQGAERKIRKLASEEERRSPYPGGAHRR